MRHLPPNPPHVLTPRDSELQRIRGDLGGWTTVARCRTCSGTGSFRWFEPVSRDVDTGIVDWECSCEEQTILFWWLTAHGLPAVSHTWAWADLFGLSAPATKWASRVISDPAVAMSTGEGVLLTGAHGTGKTALAALVLKEFLRVGRTGQFIRATTLVEGLLNWRNQETISWINERVLTADILVIDDLGDERVTKEDAAASVVSEALISRQDRNLVTIVTSKLSAANIGDRYGQVARMAMEEMTHVTDVGEPWHQRWFAARQQRSALGLSAPVVFG